MTSQTSHIGLVKVGGACCHSVGRRQYRDSSCRGVTGFKVTLGDKTPIPIPLNSQ